MGDFNNIIHTVVEEAEMRGHATGLAEGLERGREDVACMTGLSVEELRQVIR